MSWSDGLQKTGIRPKVGAPHVTPQGRSWSCVMPSKPSWTPVAGGCGVRLALSALHHLISTNSHFGAQTDTQFQSQDGLKMSSQNELFDKQQTWPTASFTWTSFLYTCLFAVVAGLVARHVFFVKTEPAVPFSVAIPPQLASDYQWDVKGKKAKADDPEVCS